MPHGGGKRFDESSEPYSIIRSWIANGTPRYSADAPTVTSLTMFPDQKVMSPNEQQQLSVTAHYSDGSKRDVTRLATLLSNLDVVAKVNERGLVETLNQSGEAAIMAQYMGRSLYSEPSSLMENQDRKFLTSLRTTMWTNW